MVGVGVVDEQIWGSRAISPAYRDSASAPGEDGSDHHDLPRPAAAPSALMLPIIQQMSAAA